MALNVQGRCAAIQVHREVEIDLFETYVEFIVTMIDDQPIPHLLALNWGAAEEFPYVEVETTGPAREQEIATRDKTNFVEMASPAPPVFIRTP